MTAAISSIMGRLDDRINPVVVKELRQAVQSRFVTVTLLLFLVVLLVTIHIALLGTDLASGGGHFELGRGIFIALQVIVAVTCILFVPIYAGIRFAAERSSDNVDLLFISTIRPISIVSGKLFSAMVVAVLIYSAVLPFMTLTYLLRGIDLPTVFVVVALHMIVILASTMAALFLACIPAALPLKVIIGLIFTVSLFIVASYTAAGSGAMAYSGVGSQLNTWDFWAPALVFIEKTMLAIGLMFFLTVSIVSPPSSNRALPIRLFIIGAWIVELLLAVILAGVASRWGGGFFNFEELILGSWIGGQVMLLTTGLLVAICERDTWSPRVLRHVPRHPIGRAAMFVLSSGSAGGVIWTLGMIALTLGSAWLVWRFTTSSGSYSDVPDFILAMCLLTGYAYCYAMTGALLRWLFRDKLLPRVSAVFALGLLVLGSVGPVILAFFIWGHRWDDHETFCMLLNPIGPLALWDNHPEFRVASTATVLIWAALVSVFAIPWVAAQWSRFKRHEVAAA
jgi:hypothetical protein